MITSRIIALVVFLLSFASVVASDAYQIDNFLISHQSVSFVEKGMTIGEVLHLLPSRQVQKIVSHGEFEDDLYDDYLIFDSEMNHVFTLTPHVRNNLESEINRVLIEDQRFRTASDIGLGSTFEEIMAQYPNVKASPDMEVIVLHVDELNSWHSIDKKHLLDGWWDDYRREIKMDKIPPTAKTETFVLWWN
jgi:hypothetical protein|tara:strand:- start:119 stop:691 length:573 start_codon:yes stop_codon:yes gene_type:complete